MHVIEVRNLDSSYFCVVPRLGHESGACYMAAFASAKPFPHVVIDDFLDRSVLQRVIEEFPTAPPAVRIDSRYQQGKLSFPVGDISSGFIRNLLVEFMQEPMLRFIEGVTGLRHLIPDPYFAGAGLHETKPGGRLMVHADFNLSKDMRVQRRLNLILYLNPDWQDSYGGHLELWDRKARSCVAKVLPVFGRAVIFQTDLDCFHGHPQPLTCPAGRSRRSLAMYYYTAPERGIASLPKRQADFRTASGSDGTLRRDWRRVATSLAVDVTPPIIYRALRRLAGGGS